MLSSFVRLIKSKNNSETLFLKEKIYTFAGQISVVFSTDNDAQMAKLVDAPA